MARQPTVPEKIEKYLEDAGSRGITKQDLHSEFGQSAYYYTILLQLAKQGKASKLGERWYYGSPDQWRAEVDVDAWINIKTPATIMLRWPTLILKQETKDSIDQEELRRRATEGLEYYFLWCRMNNEKFPIATDVCDTAKASGRINDLIQSVRL